MKKDFDITDAEYEVLKALWEKYPATVTELQEKLQASFGWKLNTVQTLLGRLVKKGKLDFAKKGKAYYYSPLVSREECLTDAGSSFLNRFFEGSALPMMAHFIENKKLSKSEIRKLRDILKSQEEEK